MKKFPIICGTISFVTLIFCLVLFISCNKGKTKYNDSTLVRPCDNVICLNGGTCNDGLCNCPQGFEGNQCQTRWSKRFIGNYTCDDNCDTSAAGFYEAVVSEDIDFGYKIKLSNVGVVCSGAMLNAIINPEKTSFMIPMQNTCGDQYLSGYGNLNGGNINIFLTARDTILHTSKQCSVLMIKH